MDAKILLGKILQKFRDKKYCQVSGYNRFGFVEERDTYVVVSRENGEDTDIPFKKLLVGIEGYQSNISDFDKGPTALRAYGITHITSPIFSLLHLLKKDDYLPSKLSK